MFLNFVSWHGISGSLDAGSVDKAAVFVSINRKASNRSVSIADDFETSRQQRSHDIYFGFWRVMMPAHYGVQSDALIHAVAGLLLRRCQCQQPIFERVQIQFMVPTLA